jgi:hypothetical protein
MIEDLEQDLPANKSTLNKYRSRVDPNLYRVSIEDIEQLKVKKTPKDDLQQDEEDPLKDVTARLSQMEQEREALKKQNSELEQVRLNQEQNLLKSKQELDSAKDNEVEHAMIILQSKYEAEEVKAKEALNKYKAARSNNDYELELEAQDELNNSKYNLGQYKTDYDTLEQYHNNNYQRDYQEQREVSKPNKHQNQTNINTTQTVDYFNTPEMFEEGLKLVEPKIAEWARPHMDDLISSKERQQLAFDADRMAVQVRGYIPGSKQYIAYMDENLGYSDNEEQPKPIKETRRRDREGGNVNYSAPPSKVSSISSSKSPSLDDAQLEEARASGSTPDEWQKYVKTAQSIMKESNKSGHGIYRVQAEY